MSKEILSELLGNKRISDGKLLGSEQSPFNDLANELKSEHFQWVTAISVGILVSVYANGLGYLSLLLNIQSIEISIYQSVNLMLMTIFFMLILFIYGRYAKFVYPKLIKVNEDRWLKDDKYTEKKDAIKEFKKTVFGFLPIRFTLYTFFIIFWFGMKYSIVFFFGKMQNFKIIDENCCGIYANIIVVIAVIIFLFLLDSPIIYSYIRIKKIYK